MRSARFEFALAGAAIIGALATAAFFLAHEAHEAHEASVADSVALAGPIHHGVPAIDARDAESSALDRAESILAPLSSITGPAPWETDADTARQHAHRRISALAVARSAARAAFGAEAEQLAIFRPIFDPVADRFPDLPSHMQIAIAEAEASAIAARWQDDAVAGFAQLQSEIAKTAGAVAADAYALRHAPAARALRASGIAFSADEYRQCFDALTVLLDPMLEQTRYVEARRTLRAALGSSRFSVLWSQRDPRYAELRRLAARYEFTEEKLDSAYLVLNETEDALLTQAGTAEPDFSRLRELHAMQQRRLAEVLGEPTATAVLRELAVWAAHSQ